jgi:nucleoid-associated protein YgaU
VAPEKAVIKPRGGEPIHVLFNPTEYGLDASFVLATKQVVGGTEAVQYVNGSPRVLTMDLLFDTYELGTDVRRHTNRLYGLLDVGSNEQHPPIVEFRWGALIFECLVEHINGRFTLFLDSGVPVRATLTVTFKQWIDPATVTVAASADHTKTYLTKRGDSVSSIAQAEYGDPANWRPIAAANSIDNPRVLEAGQRIVIPPPPER